MLAETSSVELEFCSAVIHSPPREEEPGLTGGTAASLGNQPSCDPESSGEILKCRCLGSA